MARWQDHFPIGVFVDANDTDQGGKTATLVRTLQQNNLRYIMWTNCSPYFVDAINGQSAVIDNAAFGGPVYHVYSPTGRLAAGAATGLDGDWYLRDGVNQADADATTMTTAILAELPNKVNMLGYNLGDDITTFSWRAGSEVAPIVRAFRRADPTRFSSAVVVDNSVWALLPSDLEVGITYRYPCGRYTNNTDTAEGDFHRTGVFGAGVDWVTSYRSMIANLPANARMWYIAQAHQNIDSPESQTQLRMPYPSEMGMQVWQAIGEGVKGIFFFLWGDNGGLTTGLGSVGSEARLAALRRASDRINPTIRQKLIRSTKVTDIFVASGGGNATYPTTYANAYIATLRQDNGRYLCVVCNHSASTASVTITGPGLTGRLVNLETGVATKLGGSVSLAAFDGAIYELDPFIGVPKIDPDYSQNVKYYWDHHFANPDAAEYIAPGSLNLHTNVVTVTNGQNLQSVVDAAPDYTTFRLQAGTYDEIRLVGRSHLHFVADDDAHRPTMRSAYFYGCTHSQYINGEIFDGSQIGGWVGKLINTPLPAERYNFLHPKQDIILRNIDFVSDGTLVEYKWYYLNPGVWTHDHGYVHAPLFFRNMRDVCVEGCTFSGYTFGDETTAPSQPPPTGVSATPTQVGPVAYAHAGFINGNAGVNHIVVRSCTFTAAERTGGSKNAPCGTFFDGSCGSVLTDNTFLPSPVQGNSFTNCYQFLTNDDFTMDAANDGHADLITDLRSTRYNVCARTAFLYSELFITWMGGDNLAIANEGPVLANNSGSLAVFIEVSGRNTQKAAYDSTGNMIMDNITHGINWTGAFVDVRNDLGSNGGFNHDLNEPEDGRVGQTTITGNQALGGVVTAWMRTNGTNPPPATPDVITGNTDSGGSRDGV